MNCETRVQDGVSARLQEIRDALGAVAVGEPAVYRLTADARGLWLLRHDGKTDERCFENRASALAAARLAVVRSRSYRLIIQGEDGRVSVESFNWPAPL